MRLRTHSVVHWLGREVVIRSRKLSTRIVGSRSSTREDGGHLTEFHTFLTHPLNQADTTERFRGLGMRRNIDLKGVL